MTLDMYSDYLRLAFDKVVQESLRDESLRVLADMENKNFYFSRLLQLFVDIYSSERENKIRALTNQLQSLNSDLKNESEDPSPWLTNLGGQQILCSKCQQPDTSQGQQVKLAAEKQNIHQLLKQNHDLSKQVSARSKQHLEEMMSVKAAGHQREMELCNKIQTLDRCLQAAEKKCRQLKDKQKTEALQCETLREQLVKEREQTIRANEKLKDKERMARNSEEANERLRSQLASLRQCKQILEDKVRRLQELQAHHKKHLSLCEKQLKSANNLKQFSEKQMVLKDQQKGTEDEEQQRSEGINFLLVNLTTKQMEVKKLATQNGKLAEEKEEIRRKYNEYRNQAQKALNEQGQNFNRAKQEYEKELRSFRENQRAQLINLREREIQGDIAKMKQWKELARNAEAQRLKLQAKVVKIEHSNQILVQNYQQITEALRQEKNSHRKIVQELLDDGESRKRVERELEKRLELREAEQRLLERQAEERIKAEQEKIEYLQRQLQERVLREEKLSKQIHISEVEAKQTLLKGASSRQGLRQHELMVRINELQNVLEEARSQSRELLANGERKLKQLGKQMGEKCEQVTVLRYQVQKLRQEKEGQSKLLAEAQRNWGEEQQKLIKMQEINRRQMMQMMSSYESKLREQSEESGRPNKLVLSKQGGQDGSSMSAIRKLETQHRLRVQNLQSQNIGLRASNAGMQNKLRVAEQNIHALQERVRISEDKQRQARVKQSAAQEELQRQKNKEMVVIRYYEDKISKFKGIFRDFKYEICQQLLSANLQVRDQLNQLERESRNSIQLCKKMVHEGVLELQQRFFQCQDTIYRKGLSQEIANYHLQLQKCQKQMGDTVAQYERRLKQKQMQTMTFVAQKEFALEQHRQNETLLMKRFKELQTSYVKLVAKAQKNEKIELQLKQIVSKMENKVNDAEKQCLTKKKEVQRLQETLREQKMATQKMEKHYRQVMKESQQKHREQMEKIFNKYEREFNKMINLSSRKGKEGASSIGLYTTKGFEIPTKGVGEDKFSKLRRQIQEQKKMVQEMQKVSGQKKH